jgi:uncharacterized RDD family membrane protein YckC
MANGNATAPALETLPGRQPLISAPPEKVTYQPSLFRDAPGGPKVIPIPTLAPKRPQEREPAPLRSAPRGASAGMPTRSTSSRRGSDSQQTLDFQSGSGSSGLRVEAVIYCDAPVALPSHRIIAAAFDLSMIAVALGMFLAIFFVSGGVLAFSRQNAPFFIGVAVLLTLFYRALFCLANGESPGMRFAGLRLVDFDGRTPDRDQRGIRQIASLLSLLSAGLGLVWALVDEENLTWHDHISKTFPTVG